MKVATNYEFILDNLVDDLSKNNAIFLVGAGISMAPPSDLPAGIELKEIIIGSLYEGTELSDSYKILVDKEKYKGLIPEVAFSDVFFILRDKLFAPFKILELSPPNRNHASLAYLASKWRVPIFTTNFDLLLEECAENDARIFHLHGDLKTPDSIMVLLSQIGQRAKPIAHVEFLKNAKQKNLYVFGYSGNDIDIMDLIRGSDVDKIFWMLRNADDDWTKRNLLSIEQKKLAAFSCDISHFIEKLMLHYPGTASANKYMIVKKREQVKRDILSEFSDGAPLAGKYLLLMLLFYRIQQYRAASDLCHVLIKKNMGQREHRLRAIIWYSETTRFLSTDRHELYLLLDKEIRQSGNDVIDGELLNTKGVLLLSDDENTVARQCFRDAERIFKNNLRRRDAVERRRVRTFLSLTYNNIGLTHYNDGEYRLARAYFKKSLKIKREIGHIFGSAASTANLALVSYALQDERRIKYWEKHAFALIEKYQMHQRKVDLLRDTGELMAKQGKHSEGAYRLIEARNICLSKMGGNEKEADRIEALLQSLIMGNPGTSHDLNFNS